MNLSKFEADPMNARYRLAGPDGLKFARDFCLWFASSNGQSLTQYLFCGRSLASDKL